MKNEKIKRCIETFATFEIFLFLYYENHSYQKFWILLKDIFEPETKESIPFYNKLKRKT